jgi:hypothetical protein
MHSRGRGKLKSPFSDSLPSCLHWLLLLFSHRTSKPCPRGQTSYLGPWGCVPWK